MKVQVNKWMPEQYRFQSYEDATVYEGDHVTLKQIDDHPHYGPRFALQVGDEIETVMEGVEISFHGGELCVRGYVPIKEHPYFTDKLRRETWFLLEA